MKLAFAALLCSLIVATARVTRGADDVKTSPDKARPVKPSPSVVVALMLTASSLKPRMAATLARIAKRWGPTRGPSQITVQSIWSMIPPSLVITRTACFANRSELAPFH